MFKCPVCKSEDFKIKYKIISSLKEIPAGLIRPNKINVNIISCKNCGLEANSKIQDNFDFSALYKQQSIYSESETYKVTDEYLTYTKDITDIVQFFYKNGDNILEIGAFIGNLLLKFLKIGIKERREKGKSMQGELK